MPPAPRDIYEDDVDFSALAAQDPAFAKKLKPNKQLDFSDPESVLQLTKSLLRRDFDLDIDLPNDRLCPPVPNRFNYILWLQDLIDSTSPDYRETYDPNRQVVGIDIGTGASAIYPLLACRQRPKWNMVATESDAKSFEYASRNVSRNGLEDRIKVAKVESGGKGDPLVPESVLKRFERLDFLLTNPPFYSSLHSLLTSASRKSLPPNSICTGSDSEIITPGGEIGFVSRLIHQSTQPEVRHKVQWWSGMLGKLSSVGVVVEMLKREGVRNWAVKEFVQGQRTRRWGVAWSWGGLRPEGRVARGLNVGKVKAVKRGREAVERAAGRKRAHVEDVEDESEREEEHESGQGVEAGLLPFPPEFGFELPPAAGVEADPDDMGRKIDAAIRNLEDIKWQWKPAQHVGLGIAQDGDCWSRRARRRKEKEKRQMNEDEGMKEDGDEDEDEDKEKEPAFAFKIKVGRSSMDGEKEMGGVVMTVRWLQGQDHVLFESFCGWVKRKSGS